MAKFWINMSSIFCAGIIIRIILEILIRKKVKHDSPTPNEIQLTILLAIPIFSCLIAIPPMIAAISRTETMVFIEGNDIVSTGCRLGRPYREIAHFKDVTVQILHHMKDRYEPEYYLIALRWPHQRDSLYAGLDSPLLARLTPEAVTNYVKQLQAKHLPIPPNVQRLVDKTNHS